LINFRSNFLSGYPIWIFLLYPSYFFQFLLLRKTQQNYLNISIFFYYLRRLTAAETQLEKLATGLNTVESRVAQLQKELAERTRGAAELQLRAESSEASLSTARALLQKLDTEHRDWQNQLQELTARKERLNVEAANAAALLIYQVRRLSSVNQKRNVPDIPT